MPDSLCDGCKVILDFHQTDFFFSKYLFKNLCLTQVVKAFMKQNSGVKTYFVDRKCERSYLVSKCKQNLAIYILPPYVNRKAYLKPTRACSSADAFLKPLFLKLDMQTMLGIHFHLHQCMGQDRAAGSTLNKTPVTSDNTRQRDVTSCHFFCCFPAVWQLLRFRRDQSERGQRE